MLLNVHIRRCLDSDLPLEHVFDGNWIIKAFYEVTDGEGIPQRDPELIRSAELLPGTHRVSRRGMKQLLQANANVIATVAHNNVWMHFRRRLLAHVKRCHALTREQYAALTAEERSRRRLDVFRAVDDLCKAPSKPLTSSDGMQAWVHAERRRLGIDDVMHQWTDDKPVLYHLKSKKRAPSFLPIMRKMSLEAEAAGGRAMSLFPLRPVDGAETCPLRQDLACQTVLQAFRNERLGRKRKQRDDDSFTFRDSSRCSSRRSEAEGGASRTASPLTASPRAFSTWSTLVIARGAR
jgi:hypothetical protein